MREYQDYYFHQAKREHYLARSAYKLIEIHQRYHILNNIKHALELGASPGSWSQVFVKHNIYVNAIDIQAMKYHHKNIHFILADLYTNTWKEKLTTSLFDIIASDIACNSTGALDATRNMYILAHITKILYLLRSNGTLIVKSFQCNELHEHVKTLKSRFAYIKLFKPQASRKESSEIYVLGLKYKIDS